MSAGAWLVAHEGGLRLGVFLGLFLVLRAAESVWRLRDAGAWPRQASNLGLMVVYTLVLRFAFPVLAVAWAAAVHQRGGGLFGLLALPGWLEAALAVLLLDLAIYWQHRVLHMVPLLWRLHRVHHCDVAFDVSTGVRFHPLEIAFSMAWKLAVVTALGASPLAVVLFELLLSSASLFTHANFALHPRIDRALRRVLVTPSMHRIHHSVVPAETDSNFGFLLTAWDRLFASYRAQPASPEATMPIGLREFREPADQGLLPLLRQPFRRRVSHA